MEQRKQDLTVDFSRAKKKRTQEDRSASREKVSVQTISSNTQVLHPSWAAKQLTKQKQALAITIPAGGVATKGNKITFDD